MSEENDSLDEGPMTEQEMLECGRNIGAEWAVFGQDSGDDFPTVVYVMPGKDVDDMVERCEGGCPSVWKVKL